VIADGVDECRAERLEAFGSQAAFQVGVRMSRSGLYRPLEFGSAIGQANQSAATIVAVDLTREVATLLEVAQEVVDRLFGDLKLVGESRRPAAIKPGVR
jgi:hypothetical protein